FFAATDRSTLQQRMVTDAAIGLIARKGDPPSNLTFPEVASSSIPPRFPPPSRFDEVGSQEHDQKGIAMSAMPHGIEAQKAYRESVSRRSEAHLFLGGGIHFFCR